MGKQNHRSRGKQPNNRKGNVWQQDKKGGEREYEETLVFENEAFSDYYKVQKVVPTGTDEEWEQVLATMQKPLPTTFRINGSEHDALEFRDMLKERYLKNLTNIEVDGEIVDAPRELPWYPKGLGWHVSTPRHVLRKHEGYKRFHKFLQVETAQGNISRQEAVSMIPPFFLDVQPHHKVLDMCAAPGSKTAQLLEFLHANGVTEPTRGIVIANDVDFRRCEMLVHQTKRIGSPSLLVLNHPAQNIPTIRHLNEAGEVVNMEFDRILADVPCSGDGTMRKAPDMWRKWGHGLGHGLHRLQTMIATRGIQMLKVGGRLVYSTCSMNPIEDEAVVAELLRAHKGTIRLVDVSDHLPKLVRSPGLETWKVLYRGKDWCNVMEDSSDPYREKKVLKSFFAPTPEEVKEFNLKRCVRVFPQQQDTGAFFIAVFEKTARLGGEKRPRADGAAGEAHGPETAEAPEGDDSKRSKPEGVQPEGDAEVLPEGDAEGKPEGGAEGKPEGDAAAGTSADPAKKSVHPSKIMREEKRKWREAPFLPVPDETLAIMKSFYGFPDSFNLKQIMQRGDRGNKFYFCSPLLRDVLDCNDWDKLKVVAGGNKAFEKSNGRKDETLFRLAQEARELLLPYVPKRTCPLPFTEFSKLMELGKVKVGAGADDCAVPTLHAFAKDIEQGSIVITLDMKTADFTTHPHLKNSHFTVVAWRGAAVVDLFMPKMEMHSIKRQLGLPGWEEEEDRLLGLTNKEGDADKAEGDADKAEGDADKAEGEEAADVAGEAEE